MRFYSFQIFLLSFTAITIYADISSAQSNLEREFEIWLQTEFRPNALGEGVSAQTFDQNTSNIRLDLTLPGLRLPGQEHKKQSFQQAEFRSPARYFNEKNLNALAVRGRQLKTKHAALLAELEQTFGVPSGILLAIWGRETAYGNVAISKSAIDVLATRAFLSDRRSYFTQELIAALKIIQNGDISKERMKSSWAGAMGQPQFVPRSYLAYAIDFDGDGKRDIWNSVPDILASIANFLSTNGWQRGRDWGFEVLLQDGANCALEGPDLAQPIALWAKSNVARVSGRPFPDHELTEDGMLLLPAGTSGPEFIVTENFYMIKTYNRSDNYALYIGNLADRITYGMGAFKTPWRRFETMYRSDIKIIQEHLESLGYDVGGADGLPGYKTRRAIGMWQAESGMAQTCFPSNELLKRIK